MKPSQTQQLREAANAANRTEIISPANEQYENRSKLLRYHYKQETLRMQRKQRSGIQAEYKRNTSGSIEYSESSEAEYKRQQLILLPIWSASSGVLFVGC